MTLLISNSDFDSNNRVISKSTYTIPQLNQYIADSQFEDIQPLLGEELYNDLLQNSAIAKYQTLLNGGVYSYQGKTYTNVGLKRVIVFYAYARYVLFGANVDTPFGHVVKTNPNSQPTEYQIKKAIAKSNQKSAYTSWENVRDFIERNKTDYPLWDIDCEQSYATNFRITKID